MNAIFQNAAVHDPQSFDSAEAAVAYAAELYDRATRTLAGRFAEYAAGKSPDRRVRACYPIISKVVDREALRVDPRVSFGFCQDLGTYAATLTRPALFRDYYTRQIALLLENHGGTVQVGVSELGIPIHFAFNDDIAEHSRSMDPEKVYSMGRYFDVPDLTFIDDQIVNGTAYPVGSDGTRPLALFTAPRVDYSLHRLKHYTGTDPEHFQGFVLLTNYQFYVEEFRDYALSLMAGGPGSGSQHAYEAFVEPGNVLTANANLSREAPSGTHLARLPQMPAYHLKRADGRGITLINIGVGPSNAKNITDHIAVLRPHCWLMLGHCAGLRKSQRLGDYVLGHAYLREDQVLDSEFPVSVPVPPIAEVQQALQATVAEVTGFSDYDLKRLMRTGTVATVADRNWELRLNSDLGRRFSLSCAIAVDMESATIATNGLRFRVPYGTLLCVSDKPLHGEIKLPGMADRFYRERVNQHLKIGLDTMEKLRNLDPTRLHSRKLRTFTEPAFR